MILGSACLLAVVILCDSAQLQVTIEGTDRAEPCMGENITYTCNVSGNTHVWSAPGLLNANPTVVILISTVEETLRYILRPVSDDVEGNIISSLTVFSDNTDDTFGNINVTCADVSGLNVQQTIFMVLAPPSAPSITAVGSGTDSFDFTISPPLTSEVCVVNYKVITNRSVNPIILVGPGTLQFARDGFNLCSDTYNFTVVPLTLDENGESNSFIITPPGRVSEVSSTPDSLIWSPPANVPSDCHVQYNITGNGVTLVVNTNMVTSTTLNDAGFPYCVGLTVTITPLDVNNNTIDISSSTVNVAIIDPDIDALELNVTLGAIDNNIYPVSISSTPPTTDERVSITYSDFDSINCTQNLRTGMTSARLDCSGGGGTVIFCGQLTSGECVSNRMKSVEISSCAPPVSVTAIVAAVVVLVIVTLVVVIVIVFIVYCKVKGGKTHDDEHELKSGPSYTYTTTSSAANDGGGAADLYDEVTTIKTRSSDNLGDNLPTYQAPDTIRREAAGGTGGGDMYTVPEKKKKNGGVAPAADVADMYSVPDKTKKKQNEGLTYADIDMSRPSKKRARPPPNQGFVVQEDPGSVTYSTVNH